MAYKYSKVPSGVFSLSLVLTSMFGGGGMPPAVGQEPSPLPQDGLTLPECFPNCPPLWSEEIRTLIGLLDEKNPYGKNREAVDYYTQRF